MVDDDVLALLEPGGALGTVPGVLERAIAEDHMVAVPGKEPPRHLANLKAFEGDVRHAFERHCVRATEISTG